MYDTNQGQMSFWSFHSLEIPSHFVFSFYSCFKKKSLHGIALRREDGISVVLDV